MKAAQNVTSALRGSGQETAKKRGQTRGRPFTKGDPRTKLGGRPPSAKTIVKRTAAQILANVEEERLWRDLLLSKNQKIALAALQYLTDRRDGRPAQAIDLTHHEDLFAGRTVDELEFFAVHGYWPGEGPAKAGKA